MAIPEFPISRALPSDSQAIATLFSLSWTSPFTQLQFGYVEPTALAASMAPRIEKHMNKPSTSFVVARHPATNEVVAVAQWNVIVASADRKTKKMETKEEKEEREHFEDEVYRKNLPETSNKDLIMEFSIGLRTLREDTLQGRDHYLLENLATHPDYRGRGLASKLIASVFPEADEKDLLIYLDTASDNKAMNLYKKLGFEEKGNRTIEDLSKYGGEGSETHVAFVRYPMTRNEEEFQNGTCVGGR